MKPSAEFGELDNSQLAGLVFELASQLHEERTRRLALEGVLAARGLLDEPSIQAAAATAEFRRLASDAADRAVRGLLRVLSESDDPRTPLRAEAPAPDGGV
jgi:hypothetical protein